MVPFQSPHESGQCKGGSAVGTTTTLVLFQSPYESGQCKGGKVFPFSRFKKKVQSPHESGQCKGRLLSGRQVVPKKRFNPLMNRGNVKAPRLPRKRGRCGGDQFQSPHESGQCKGRGRERRDQRPRRNVSIPS